MRAAQFLKFVRGCGLYQSRTIPKRLWVATGLLGGFSATHLYRGSVVRTESEVDGPESFAFLDEVEEFSEPAALPTESGAKHVIGKELISLVTKPKKDVFILKYTEHCPSCLIFRTLTEQLAGALKGVDSIVIGLYRSDLNYCDTPAYTRSEHVSDPVPKLFPAVGDNQEERPGVTMELQTCQSETILKWLHDNCTHKFDYDAALKRLRQTHAVTDELLITRYEEFNAKTGTKDAQRVDWHNPKTPSYFTFYKSLCDPWNPCAAAELRWFAHMMTYKARSQSIEEKDAQNKQLLEENINCKLSSQFEAYLKAVSEFALNQMDLVDSQRARREGKPVPSKER